MSAARLIAHTSGPIGPRWSGTQTAAWMRPRWESSDGQERRAATAAARASRSAIESGVMGDLVDAPQLVRGQAQDVVGDAVLLRERRGGDGWGVGADRAPNAAAVQAGQRVVLQPLDRPAPEVGGGAEVEDDALGPE